MKTYQEMVQEYKRRQRSTVVDTIAAGLTYMDEIALDTGLLEETGLLTELTETACGALPFAIIAVTGGQQGGAGEKDRQEWREGRRFPHGQNRGCHGHRQRGDHGGRVLGGASGHHGRTGAV